MLNAREAQVIATANETSVYDCSDDREEETEKSTDYSKVKVEKKTSYCLLCVALSTSQSSQRTETSAKSREQRFSIFTRQLEDNADGKSSLSCRL